MTYEVQKRCCKCVSMIAANQFLADEQRLPSYMAYEYRILECEE